MATDEIRIIGLANVDYEPLDTDVLVKDNSTNGSRGIKGEFLNNIVKSIAPLFVATRTSSNKYLVGERVMYRGKLYKFKNEHYGAWVSADVTRIDLDSLFKDLPLDFCTNEVLTRLVGNRLDDSQFVLGVELGSNGAVISQPNRGNSGLCPCVPGETLYFWQDGVEYPNQFYHLVSFFDIEKNYIRGHISSDYVRKQVVPENAYYFSMPIIYVDGAPRKTVVANYLPTGFIPYSTSSEKTSAAVVSANCPENVFDPSAVTDGKYISGSSNGEEVWTTDSTYCESDYIKITSRYLYCWYENRTVKDKYPWVYVAQYDSSKNFLRVRNTGSGQLVALTLDADVAYVRLSVLIVNKYSVSYGHSPFNSFVPYGYVPKCVLTKDVANGPGDSEEKPISQKAATDMFNAAGVEPTDFQLDLTGMETDILSTSRNYILKEYVENSTRYFEFSNDCGKTYTKVENTIGQINFVHFFSTGRVLICSDTKCYYTDDFSEFTETTVYDYDGTIFVPNVHHFFRSGNYDSEYSEINGQEVLVWNDYSDATGYKSRVWYTDDYGVTLKCILKDDETLDVNGNLIEVSHFHRTWLDNSTGCIWVTSGDYGNLCKLLKGNLNNGTWAWDVVNKGDLYKFGQFIIRGPYAYFITDYTTGKDSTGIVCCPVNGLGNPKNFRYLYRTANNEPLSKYFEDDNGYRVLIPDFIGYKKFWFANGNFDFKLITITGVTQYFAIGNVYGSNYLGEVIINAITNGYDFSENPNMNLYPRYNFGQAMKNVGFKKFGNIANFIK